MIKMDFMAGVPAAGGDGVRHIVRERLIRSLLVLTPITVTAAGLFWGFRPAALPGVGSQTPAIEREAAPSSRAFVSATGAERMAHEASVLGSPSSMPLDQNERVLYWVGRFTTDQRPTFQLYLDRHNRYVGLIQQDARRRGLPEELAYLAMIESGFSNHAVSHVEAVGLWQFMGPTAQAYGLRIDEWIDERRDPYRATQAALDYLSTLYERYGSWYLAAAAYNAGPARVDQALLEHFGRRFELDRLRAQPRSVDGLDLYWQIIDRLPYETRHHVPRMIAATLLARNPERYGFRRSSLATPVQSDVVWVPAYTSLWRVARLLSLPVALLYELNPQLVAGVTPPAQVYGLRVPKGLGTTLVQAFAQ